MIDLSVLICSTHTRWNTFGQSIQKQVWDQYNALPQQYQDRIEIIILTDNKKMMLGHKRNVMVDMAQGRYVQFVDDDDRIAPDMFARVLDATDANSDVITFLVSVSINDEAPKICRYSIDYEQDRNTEVGYERLPNHICVVKRDIARKVSFPNIPYGEDSAYSKLLKKVLRTETHIPQVLYHYDYSSETTETQQHLSAALRRRSQEPIVDVVMMSNSPSPQLMKMTQQAINTCIAGANSLPVNIIVLEQQPDVAYVNANTIHAPEPFHYNQFANRGAKYGTAPWIMVANNDLVFQDGWLHQLLLADHPVVSPKCPDDIRQRHVTENTCGYNNAEHFSGWCFMIKRELWEKIGGFDPDFGFWCADDAVIEQLKAIDVQPMMVPKALVQHRGSVTLKRRGNTDDLTWPYVQKFNAKYGADKFLGDSRYESWKRLHGATR